MIKVNLLPTKKKKKKAKKIPGFILPMIVITVIVAVASFFVWNYYNGIIDAKNKEIRDNDKLIAELKEKIKEVEDYERRNKLFASRKEVIEQLGRNKTVPVKMVDEVSAVLPTGVWITSLDMKGRAVNIDCIAFSNTDVVNYINNLKNSKIFDEIYLKESVQKKIGSYTLYQFKVSFNVKG